MATWGVVAPNVTSDAQRKYDFGKELISCTSQIHACLNACPKMATPALLRETTWTDQLLLSDIKVN